MKYKPDEILDIGIIGGGAVGTATAAYLVNQGISPTLYKRAGPETQLYRDAISHHGLVVNNPHEISGFTDDRPSFEVTSDLSDLTNSQMILVCSPYTAHLEVGKALKDRSFENIPIIAFPGKLASSYMLGYAGEIGQSVFDVTKDVDYDAQTVSIRIHNRLNGIEFTHGNPREIPRLLYQLNAIFGEGSFTNGAPPIKVGLQSHSLNVIAINSHGGEILANKEQTIEIPLYRLQQADVDLFERIFEERQQVASEFGWQLKSMEDYLDKRAHKPHGNTLLEKINDTYGDYLIKVSKNNRRLHEDPWSLALFADIADQVGVKAEASEELLASIRELRHKLGFDEPFGYKASDLNLDFDMIRILTS